MHQLLERRKKKECGRRQIHPEGDNKRDPSFIHLPSGEQAGDGESHGHKGEIKSGVYADPDLSGVHRDISGSHTIRNGEQ